MARTGLRPLSTGEVLDGAFSLYRERFGIFVTTAALCGVPGLLAGFLLPNLLASLVGGAMGLIAFAALTWMAAETVVGRPVELSSAIGFGARRVPRVIVCMAGASLVVLFVGGGGAAVIAGLVFLAGAAPDAGWRIAFVVLGGLGVGILVSYLVVRYFAVYQIAVLEDERHFLKRSALLAHGAFWKIGVVWTVGSIVVTLPWLLVGTAAALGGAFQGFDPETADGLLVVLAALPLLTWFMNALTSPFTASLGVLLYLDQRVRKDGLDVEMAVTGLERGDPTQRKSFVPA